MIQTRPRRLRANCRTKTGSALRSWLQGKTSVRWFLPFDTYDAQYGISNARTGNLFEAIVGAPIPALLPRTYRGQVQVVMDMVDFETFGRAPGFTLLDTSLWTGTLYSLAGLTTTLGGTGTLDPSKYHMLVTAFGRLDPLEPVAYRHALRLWSSAGGATNWFGLDCSYSSVCETKWTDGVVDVAAYPTTLNMSGLGSNAVKHTGLAAIYRPVGGSDCSMEGISWDADTDTLYNDNPSGTITGRPAQMTDVNRIALTGATTWAVLWLTSDTDWGDYIPKLKWMWNQWFNNKRTIYPGWVV